MKKIKRGKRGKEGDGSRKREDTEGGDGSDGEGVLVDEEAAGKATHIFRKRISISSNR